MLAPLEGCCYSLDITIIFFFFWVVHELRFSSVSFPLACTLDRCTVFYHARFSLSFFVSLPSVGALLVWVLHRLRPPRLLAIDPVCMYAMRISRLVNTCKCGQKLPLLAKAVAMEWTRSHFLTGAGLSFC